MKKTIVFVICIIVLIFLIPAIFTSRRNINILAESNISNEEEVSIQSYDYSQYTTIKLLHQDTNEIEEVNLDEYIACVVSAEMPVNYEIEALKAQAIVARTYTIYKIIQGSKHENADICDKSNCCQAWISKEDRLARWNKEEAQGNWNKILEAVNGTVGKIIVYEGKPINAFFHANSGGKTESPLYVWGGSRVPIFANS